MFWQSTKNKHFEVTSVHNICQRNIKNTLKTKKNKSSMSKRYYEIYALLLFLLPQTVSAFIATDSLSYLNPEDSVFIMINKDLNKFINHTIEPKQTIFALGQFYGLHTEDIFHYNPNLRGKILSKGQKVKIPVPNAAITRYQSHNFQAINYVPLYYQVKKGETLYRIAKGYFDMPVDSIMQKNNLDNTIIHRGQILQVGWISVKGISSKMQKSNTVSSKRRLMRTDFMTGGRSSKKFDERGIAIWRNDNGTRKIYALHRHARLNAYITVTNPMNARSVRAKVIGRLPSGVYNDDVIVVLSPRAANLLDAKDARFFVKLNY